MHRSPASTVALSVLIGTLLMAMPAAQPAYAYPSAQGAAPACGGAFVADADATISQSQPDQPLGAARELQVMRDETGRAVSASLIHFALGRQVPPGSSIQSAEVELHLAAPPAVIPYTVQVGGVAAAWSEPSVTWNSRPAATGSFGAKSYGYVAGAADGATVRIDVTALVNLWSSGVVADTSVLLQPGGQATEARFWSREGGGPIGSAPRLIVRCSPPQMPSPGNRSALDVRQVDGIDRLRTRSTTPLSIRLDTGAVRFAGFDLALPAEAGSTAEMKARWFTKTYSDLLRLSDPAVQLQMIRRSANGDLVVFRQRYKGIPVYGSELGVHMAAGRVIAVSGAYLPDIDADPTPTLTAAQAEAIVVGPRPGAEIGAASQLRYVNTGLSGGPDHDTYLTWQVSLKDYSTYFVDAASGVVRLEHPAALAGYDMDMETGNYASYSSWCGEWWGTTADDHLCSESGCNADALFDWEAPTAWLNIKNTYWWWRNNMGRNSYDGRGDEIQIYIHVGDGNHNPWPNAQFLMGGDCFEFGDHYAAAADVLDHEYTHAVIHHTSDLAYENEPGALNESFADVFAELVEGANADWLHGETLPAGFLTRSLVNPLASTIPQPDTYGGPNWLPLVGSPSEGNDFGGVHRNSGVTNKAAYLLVNGGTVGPYTITGIGVPKARSLLYQTMVNLIENATMLNMRDMMVFWARGWADTHANDFTKQNVCAVRNAYAAVGLGEGDFDCDGIENNVDGDVDGDYVPNGLDNCPIVKNPGQSDVDYDGLGDACDPDDDNDGVPDAAPDNCPLVSNVDQADFNANGVGDVCEDTDSDGFVDSADNCRDSWNPDQVDTDGDGLGNACDTDDDNDGHVDDADNCPLVANASQADGDADGVGNACDLCPTVSSPDNADPDGDGLGNPCDPDNDNDGVLDAADNCPNDANSNQLDTDHNGLGTACDQAERGKLFEAPIHTPYEAAKGKIQLPTPGGCSVCGNSLDMPYDYYREFTIELELPAYAQIVDGDGRVVARSKSPARTELKQTLSFQPALFTIGQGAGLAGEARAAAAAQSPDSLEYFLEIYPSPTAVPGQDYNLSVAFREIRTGTVYLPLLMK